MKRRNGGFGEKVFWLKAIVSGLLVAGASSLAQRHPGPAGVLIALPTTSLLALFWMRYAGAGNLEVADFLNSVGVVTLAGLGLFFITPALLRMGWSFGLALSVGALVLFLGSFVASRFF